MAKIRIFFPHSPFPPSAGADQVAAEMATELAALGHEVTFVIWKGKEEKSVPAGIRMRKLGRRGDQESRPTRVWRTLRASVASHASPEEYAYPAALLGELQRELRAYPSDWEIFHFSFAHRWLAQLPRDLGGKRAVYFHNLESELALWRAENESGPSRIHRSNAAKLRAHEANVLNWADEAWFLSPKDLELWRAFAQPLELSRARLIGPVFSPKRGAVRRANFKPEGDSPVLGWIGNLGFGPNQASLGWLLSEVAPRLQAQGFRGRILVAGGKMPEGLRREAQKFEFVEVLGFVEDAEAFWSGIDALLVPSKGGSGLQMKLIEALGSGVPVICDPEALTRLPALAISDQIHVLRDPVDWVREIHAPGFKSWRPSVNRAKIAGELDAARVFEGVF